MVKRTNLWLWCRRITLISSVQILAGCPGVGDSLRPDETAQTFSSGNRVCFAVASPGDYQPANIGINPRGTPSKEKNFMFDPALVVADGRLCIPPSLYAFPDNGQLIVEYTLVSRARTALPRKVVVGVEMLNGRASNFRLTDSEITLPYRQTNTP